MRMMLILFLAACGGGDPDPHEVVACDPSAWGARKECERACAEKPTAGVDTGGGLDNTCVVDMPGTFDPSTGKPLHGACYASMVASFEGERGCCVVPTLQSEPVPFVPCE